MAYGVHEYTGLFLFRRLPLVFRPALPLLLLQVVRMADRRVAKSILYLRSQSKDAIAALDLIGNVFYLDIVAPPPEPTDLRFDELPVPTSPISLSPYNYDEQRCGKVSRESSPGLYAVHPQVLRLGFGSNQNQPSRGFLFGAGRDCDVRLACYDTKHINKPCYFRIHYNLNSGALLITSMDRTRIESTVLKTNESLVLMADTRIDCGKGVFQFIVEFPDLDHSANQT